MSGRGTSGGVVFQAEVGAYIACLLLSESPISYFGSGFPGTPQKLSFETPDPTDDILVDTDCGQIYIQAKRTISLSAMGGELASVANQFARQYVAGVNFATTRRDFDLHKDRLLLAVGEGTAGTVRNDLREALDRNRTNAATAIPMKLTNALNAFSTHIDREWLAVTGRNITDSERKGLLSVCTVATFGESQRQVAEQSLSSILIVANEGRTLIDLLKTWAADAQRDGTGGDDAAIRLSLSSKINLKAPPSYTEDIKRLLEYSRETIARLKQFTEIITPEGSVTITRTVTTKIIDAAREGSVAITGEPGAGKSAVIQFVSEELIKDSSTVVLTVESGIINARALQDEIGLEHPLLEVMQQLGSDKPAFLILDALDAVRGGQSEATYRQLIDRVNALPGWNVIASVRTFDLRQGKEWQRSFIGKPPCSEHADSNFPLVRHVHIGLLNDFEFSDIAEKSPTLALAISAGGKKLADLSSNPFNLALLGELLQGGVPATGLANVGTRGELLGKYWDVRVLPFGLPAEISLKTFVSVMVEKRKLEVSGTDIPLDASRTIDDLHKVGVITIEKNNKTSFRHHVLFDYSVARLILFPDFEDAKRKLGRTSGAGLLLTPSLGYWLEDLKKEISSNEFWRGIVSIVGSHTIDPIIRIETARIAVESVHRDEDLSALAELIIAGSEEAIKCFQNLAGTILAKNNDKNFVPAKPWVNLLSKIPAPQVEVVGIINALIGQFIEYELDEEDLEELGKASRGLFDVISNSDHLIQWLTRSVIGYIAKTYRTDVEASRNRMLKIFVTERFNTFGHIEIPVLADDVLAMAPYDEDIVLQLYQVAFSGGAFSRDQKTTMMSSWIMGFNSNAAQDFGMAKYYLTEVFPALLEKVPKLAVQVLGVTLDAVTKHENSEYRNAKTTTISFGTEKSSFQIDSSCIWASEIDNDGDGHKDHIKIFRAFLNWIQYVEDKELLKEVPGLLLKRTGCSLGWRALFKASILKPQIIGKVMWLSLIDLQTLASLDTREIAIDAITTMYPFMDDPSLKDAELNWLSHDFSEYDDPEYYRLRIVGTLLKTIGKEQLKTKEARAFLSDKEASATIPKNEKPVSSSSWTSSQESWLEQSGVDIKDPLISQLLSLADAVKSKIIIVEQSSSEENKDELWLRTELLLQAWQASEPLNHWLDLQIIDGVLEGISASLMFDAIPETEISIVVEQLIVLSRSADPKSTPEMEEEFAKHMSWGSPSTRVKAAEILGKIATKQDLWLWIKERYKELLLQDPHPAVRFQIANALAAIGSVHQTELWAFVEEIIKIETNPSVIQACSNTFFFLSAIDRDRVETLVIDLSKRQVVVASRDDTPTNFIFQLAVWKGAPASSAVLSEWVKNFNNETERLNQILFEIRDAVVVGYNEPNQKNKMVSARALIFLRELITLLEPIVASWNSTQEPTEEQNSALKLFNEIATQLYFAAGYDKASQEFVRLGESKRLLGDFEFILSKLSALGTPGTVHHVLQLVERVSDADPELSFDIVSGALLRTTGIAKYEHERSGAQLFVKLIGRYLADHRAIFADDTRRQKLIDCLEIFVEAGWPEARQLFLTLPELLQ